MNRQALLVIARSAALAVSVSLLGCAAESAGSDDPVLAQPEPSQLAPQGIRKIVSAQQQAREANAVAAGIARQQQGTLQPSTRQEETTGSTPATSSSSSSSTLGLPDLSGLGDCAAALISGGETSGACGAH